MEVTAKNIDITLLAYAAYEAILRLEDEKAQKEEETHENHN